MIAKAMIESLKAQYGKKVEVDCNAHHAHNHKCLVGDTDAIVILALIETIDQLRIHIGESIIKLKEVEF